jgi:hypothetical protein
VTKQAPAFPGLNLWVSVHPDDDIRVWNCTAGALFLIEDLHRGQVIMHSGYSSLLMLVETLAPVPAFRKLVDKFLAEKKVKRRFAQDPVGTLVALGAQFGAERRIRAIYRVRATCVEIGRRAGIAALASDSTVTIGYPIVIEEA